MVRGRGTEMELLGFFWLGGANENVSPDDLGAVTRERSRPSTATTRGNRQLLSQKGSNPLSSLVFCFVFLSVFVLV